MTKINIPETDLKRVVIVGAGFAGLELAKRLRKSNLQIVLIDKNNYHQFQPLLYQVATAGLEPSSIAFPLRKLFQNDKNFFIRVTEVLRIEPEKKQIVTSLGFCWYDYLVIASGADTNYYGNPEIEKHVIPMKSVSEALYLRNLLFEDYEKALTATEKSDQEKFSDIVIVGGGATGVELAGALAEMKKYILPKDYHELDTGSVDIYLIQSADTLLKGMSPQAGMAAEAFLSRLGVIVKKNARVTSYDGELLKMNDNTEILAKKVIWAAGVKGNIPVGIPAEALVSNRIRVNHYSEIIGMDSVYCIGDVAYMEEGEYKGHPQVAQVAIQQAQTLAYNILQVLNQKNPKPFRYRNLGSMATIGRNHAVVDFPFIRFQGFFAWLVWLFVHLFSIIGVKNKIIVFLNWFWNYFTFDQSLRLIIRPKQK